MPGRADFPGFPAAVKVKEAEALRPRVSLIAVPLALIAASVTGPARAASPALNVAVTRYCVVRYGPTCLAMDCAPNPPCVPNLSSCGLQTGCILALAFVRQAGVTETHPVLRVRS